MKEEAEDAQLGKQCSCKICPPVNGQDNQVAHEILVFPFPSPTAAHSPQLQGPESSLHPLAPTSVS